LPMHRQDRAGTSSSSCSTRDMFFVLSNVYKYQIECLERFTMPNEIAKPCGVTKRCKDAKQRSVTDIFIIIGAIVGIFVAIFNMTFFNMGWGDYILGWIWNVAWGIVAIILCIALLAGLGLIEQLKFSLNMNWIALLVIGLAIFIPTGNFGGIIIIVAAILKIIIK
jgi:hypothetical protein